MVLRDTAVSHERGTHVERFSALLARANNDRMTQVDDGGATPLTFWHLSADFVACRRENRSINVFSHARTYLQGSL